MPRLRSNESPSGAFKRQSGLAQARFPKNNGAVAQGYKPVQQPFSCFHGAKTWKTSVNVEKIGKLAFAQRSNERGCCKIAPTKKMR